MRSASLIRLQNVLPKKSNKFKYFFLRITFPYVVAVGEKLYNNSIMDLWGYLLRVAEQRVIQSTTARRQLTVAFSSRPLQANQKKPDGNNSIHTKLWQQSCWQLQLVIYWYIRIIDARAT